MLLHPFRTALLTVSAAASLFPSIGCARTRHQEAPNVTIPVAVIYNNNSDDSVKVARAYQAARDLTPQQLIRVTCTLDEQIPELQYREHIEKVVKARLVSAPLKGKIDYLVICKGVPLRIEEGGYSVDSFLMAYELSLKPMAQQITQADFKRCANPYFGKREAFSHARYGFYLVSRLDGFRLDDALALISRATNARAEKGVFLLDQDPSKNGPGAKQFNDGMARAAEQLERNKFEARLDASPLFVGGSTGLMGYYSWGSNDQKFKWESFHSLRFRPGAIAETCVSTSARTFKYVERQTRQSLIADLISQGVTGVKGYVSEPYTVALCPPDILFDRYTSGYNLAESFWMATPLLKWKDIVIGDPLCAPYAKKTSPPPAL